MAGQHQPDDLAPLYAELAALRAEVRRKRAPRRWLPLVLVALLVALVPLAGLAAGPTFNDLNAGSVHNAYIQAIADAGITKGCDPGVSYCPNGLVTREEMASFLARTAGLGTNPPVANARTAQTATNADTATNATNATNAGNANTVGGYAPNGLVRVARGVGYPVPPGPGLPLLNAYQTLATVQIAAPAAGFVLVTGSADFQSLTCAGPPNGCFIEARLRDANTGAFTPFHFTTVGGVDTQDLALPYVFPVDAGNRTFVYEARIQAGNDGQAIAFSGLLTALYTPFGSGGPGALGAADPPSGESGAGPGARSARARPAKRAPGRGAGQQWPAPHSVRHHVSPLLARPLRHPWLPLARGIKRSPDSPRVLQHPRLGRPVIA